VILSAAFVILIYRQIPQLIVRLWKWFVGFECLGGKVNTQDLCMLESS
jgi:hypothetical protein